MILHVMLCKPPFVRYAALFSPEHLYILWYIYTKAGFPMDLPMVQHNQIGQSLPWVLLESTTATEIELNVDQDAHRLGHRHWSVGVTYLTTPVPSATNTGHIWWWHTHSTHIWSSIYIWWDDLNGILCTLHKYDIYIMIWYNHLMGHYPR